MNKVICSCRVKSQVFGPHHEYGCPCHFTHALVFASSIIKYLGHPSKNDGTWVPLKRGNKKTGGYGFRPVMMKLRIFPLEVKNRKKRLASKQ